MLGQRTGGGGRPGLPGDGGGGVPARPGRLAERPPHKLPAKVNKAATCAAHLPGAAALRPLSPDEPDRVRSGQRDRTGEKPRQRRRADAGQARAASSRRVVPAAPEVLGAVASLPDRGRPTVAQVATGSWLEGLFSAASLQFSALTHSLTRVLQVPTASGATIRLLASPVEMFLTNAFLTCLKNHCFPAAIWSEGSWAGNFCLHPEAVAGWPQSRNHTTLSLPPPRPRSPPSSTYRHRARLHLNCLASSFFSQYRSCHHDFQVPSGTGCQ
uniref:Uncharacterized protein n=2 Tax=Rhinopithecus TaxID=542827 RepID=A0A2K6LE52_RHIBE